MARPKKQVEGDKPKETKNEIYVRLAAQRVPVALKRISMLVPLAGYQPTQDQKERLLRALVDAVTAVRAAFDRNSDQQISFIP